MSEQQVSATYRISTAPNGKPKITRDDPYIGCPHQSLVQFLNFHNADVTVSVYTTESREPSKILGGVEKFTVPAKSSTGPGSTTIEVVDSYGGFRLGVSDNADDDATILVATFFIYKDSANVLQFHCNIDPDKGGVVRDHGHNLYFANVSDKPIDITVYNESGAETDALIGTKKLNVKVPTTGTAIIVANAPKDTKYYFGATAASAASGELLGVKGTLKGCIKTKP